MIFVGHPKAQRRIGGILFVVILHACAVFALVTGLERRASEIPPQLPRVIEARIIQEMQQQPEAPKVIPVVQPKIEPPKIKPPKMVRPPRHIVPPTEMHVANPPPSPSAITAVSTVVAPAAPVQPIRVVPVLDAARSCRPPQYPASSQRKGETGTVTLKFMIEEDGKVIESTVDASSGFERLDEAARQALSLCRFKPGTVDGVPERAWARLRYVWKLN